MNIQIINPQGHAFEIKKISRNGPDCVDIHLRINKIAPSLEGCVNQLGGLFLC